MPNTHTTLPSLFSDIANAIRTKTGSSATIVAENFPSAIDAIQTGTDTSDANATASDILSGKTGYVQGSKVTGNITSQAAKTWIPTTSNQTISAGKYLSGAQTIQGDSNLVAGNIKNGVSIFGVTGTALGGPVAIQGTYTKTSGGLDKVSPDPTALSAARDRMGATSIGNYALFSGGLVASFTGTKTVNAYNTSLTYSTATNLSTARGVLAATSIGNYALFGGGLQGASSTSKVVDAYDTSLTQSTATSLRSSRYNLAATSIGNYALFGGGQTSSAYSGSVDAYNTSLTRSNATVLNFAKSELAATSIGNYALFGGGRFSSSYDSHVDAYNTSLTQSAPTVLSAARGGLTATSIGNYALFGGGADSKTLSKVVDAYNTSLTRSNPTALSAARGVLAATSIGNYALFGGGQSLSTTGLYTTSAVVDAYNASLTRSTPTVLSTARYNLDAASIGNYALFCGGYGSNNYSNVVDAYTAALPSATITATFSTLPSTSGSFSGYITIT